MGRIDEAAEFLKRNFALIVILIVLLTPTVWALAGIYYQGRIELLRMEKEMWEKKSNELESKTKGFKMVLQESEIDLTYLKSN